MVTKETKQPFQLFSWNSYQGSYEIIFEHVMMYPRLNPAVQNIKIVKITKLANVWEEMEV